MDLGEVREGAMGKRGELVKVSDDGERRWARWRVCFRL